MKLSHRVLLTILTPVVLVLLFAIWFWPAMGRVAASMQQIREQQLVVSNMARDMREAVIQVQQYLQDISATRGQDGLDDGFDKAGEARAAFIANVDKFHTLFAEQGDREHVVAIEEMSQRFNEYFTLGSKMAHAYVDGGPAGGNPLMASFDQASEALQEKLKPFVDEQIAAASKKLEETEILATNSRHIALALIVAILLICSWQGWSLLRYLKAQLGGEPNDAASAAQHIAQGDLASNIHVEAGDHSSMMASMLSMQAGLAKLVDEIRSVVAAAESGDLTRRMDVSQCQGFALDIGVSLNELMETADTSLRDISRVAGALAGGDLSQTINATYPGTFGETAQAVNATVNGLKQVINDVREVVQAAAESDYSVRMESTESQGYIHTLGELLNRLTSVTEGALTDIQHAAAELAEGNLTQRVHGSYPGLLGLTANGLNATADNLCLLIGEVVAMVDAISQASSEISSGNQDLAQRTSEQAASLDKASHSIEKLTSMVRSNTERALEINNLVKESASIAADGGTVVRTTVDTMGGISNSAKRIGDIIGVIDGIAFQTNILALNAAVEAARAGEQGRGFAVVATEVRALAHRSAQAAKEIKGLITDSLDTIDQGTTQVNHAGTTMDEIVASISRVNEIMSSMASASTEQSTGIAQVNQMVGSLDAVTQQNSALVEEMAAAAESLQNQASQLQHQVSKFQLGEGGLRRLAAPVERKKLALL